MPRANRYFLPGYTWHITHRCHKQEFLFKFARDRKRWIEWLFEAKKRYKLIVLNYMVTSNHIHLMVTDDPNSKRDVIPKSIRLIAGRTAQEFNIRKNRKGAFWEDRYHATAIENDKHLLKCLYYIDMNMVRTGIIQHPLDWEFCGLHEILHPKSRYSIVDHQRLMQLVGVTDYNKFKKEYLKNLEELIKSDDKTQKRKWSKSIAVGSKNFLKTTKKLLKASTVKRKIHSNADSYELREDLIPYNSSLPLFENTISWTD